MHRTARPAMTCLTCFLVFCGVALGDDPPSETKPTPSGSRKVLVELYTSQGCNSCPAAEKVFGDLKQLGIDPTRVVPLAFHVDYFNKPWHDPYSDPLFSRREYQYSLIYQKAKKIDDPNYLYFTPMMMVDGRFPMLGSNAPEAKKSLVKALGEKPGVTLSAELTKGSSTGAERVLKVQVRPRSAELVGKEFLVAVAVTENSVTTKVESGENAGKTLTEHFVVRQFQGKEAVFAKVESRTFSFPIVVPKGTNPDRLSLAIFVQDLATGRIHQAETLPVTRDQASAGKSLSK